MDKVDPQSHFKEAWASAEQPVIEEYRQRLQDPNLVVGLRTAIAAICQIDRNETICRFKIGLLVRFLFSCLIDADRTDTADFSNLVAASMRQHGRYVDWPTLANLLGQKLGLLSTQSRIGELRRQVSESCLSASERPKGIYLLTVPTGGGKTLASLRFALNHAAK